MNIQLSEHFNYTKLMRFTLPTITMMIVTSLYSVVDGIFVSNVLGSEAFAAVNLIFPFPMMLSAVGFMIGTGGSALVSMTLGEGRKQKANEYFSMLVAFVSAAGVLLTIFGIAFIRPISMLLGAEGELGEGRKQKANEYFSMLVAFVSAAGVLLTIFGIAFIRPISMLLGAEGELLDGCMIYGSSLMLGLAPFMLQNCFQSFLVTAERPKLGLGISIAAGLTNMALDFLFIYVFPWGLVGAAAATVLSQVVGGVIPLIYFWRKNTSLLQLVWFHFEWKPIIKSCVNGSSEMLTNLSTSLLNMLYNLQLMRLVGENGVSAYGVIMYVSFIFTGTYLGYAIGAAPIVGYHYGAGNQLMRLVGENGVSAYGVIMYVSFIFTGTYLGYAIGAAPIVGYHYGAGNKKELKSLLRKSLLLITAVAVGLTALSEILSGGLAGIFVSYDPELMEMTKIAIQIYSLSYLISGFNIFGSAFFTALNDGPVSALISFVRTLLFQIIMILVLPALFGLNGVWFAVVAAEALALLVTIICFLAKRKKYQYF